MLSPRHAACTWHGFSARCASSSSKSKIGDGRSEKDARLLLDTKVSSSGSPDALFQDCINAVRQQRARLELDPIYKNVETEAITKLKQDELELTRKVFARVDPTRDVTSDLNHGAHHIDPYWNPFNKVDDVKSQVTAEFDEYSRYVSIAEAKRVRIQIKKSLKRSAEIYNPYSKGFAEHHGRGASELPPKPFRLADKYWERPPLHERLARERITWRDVDIIQHFIADNGYILPRRTTMLSRSKQKDLVNAVKRAQTMSLIPIGWRPNDYQAMPLTDPLQWMADRLIDRVIEHRDRRSEAMIRVMMERHQELNFGRFLKHVARRAEREPDGAHFEGFVEKSEEGSEGGSPPRAR